MRTYPLRFIYVLLMGVVFLSPSLGFADEGTLPAEMFSAIMFKALNYDRNIDRQGKDKVVIGVVYLNGDTQAQDFVNPVKDYISNQGSFTLKDKPMQVVTLNMDKGFDKAKFEDQLKQDNVSVLVIAVNETTSINNILEATKKLQISSICGDPQCAKSGVGLEIIKRDDKPRMVINMDSVKQEGSDYNSKFLSMCEVLK